jgi:uncharacterized membrane protein (Fun14 family)
MSLITHHSWGALEGGFAAGALVGFAIKKVLKIAAVIVGLFIAAMAYLEYEGIIHVDWAKFQTITQSDLTTFANTIRNATNNLNTGHSAPKFSANFYSLFLHNRRRANNISASRNFQYW